MLHSRGRLEFPPAFADWLAVATRSELVAVLPRDRDVVLTTRDARIRRSRVVEVWKEG